MLTKSAIMQALETGDIKIDPLIAPVGPCSLDVHMGDELLVYKGQSTNFGFSEGSILLDSKLDNPTHKLIFAARGLLLYPGVLYLAATKEVVNSDKYAITINGRSSIARLGITVESAGFVDVGFNGNITFEITVVHPVVVYPGMRIAQLAFHELTGDITLYNGKYQNDRGAQASKLYKDSDV